MSNNKMSLKRTFIMFIICLMAALTISTFVHEFVHVTQISADARVEPVSLCWDYGQDSVAHVDYTWNGAVANSDKVDFLSQNESREFMAYVIGFLTLGLFMGVAKMENYW